jgi:hypothetical protein
MAAQLVAGMAAVELVDPRRIDRVEPEAGDVDERPRGDEPCRVGKVLGGADGDVICVSSPWRSTESSR